jgi:arsenite methyltransferase
MDFDIKGKVKERYGSIAKQVSSGSSCGCGTSCCGDISNTAIIYEGANADLEDLPKDAVKASLGCANPLLLAELKEGETVLDLGSGGGIDVFMASKKVGKSGKVYGLDMTDEMLALANKNKEQLDIDNVEFIKGYIEDIPLSSNSIDLIISNCVINLSEDKEKALSEAYRVLKEGGRLSVADIVTVKEIPEELRATASMWCGCLGGTLKIEEYKTLLQQVGFKDIQVQIAHVYSKSLIQELFLQDSHLQNLISQTDLNTVDGAFAGAFIKGVK